MITVRTITDGDLPLDDCELASRFSIYHTSLWKERLETTFGHRGCYLVAMAAGEVLDVLPFFVVTRPAFGKLLISTPYEGCFGGFTSDDPSLRQSLTTEAAELSSREGARYVQIRSTRSFPELHGQGFQEQHPFFVSAVPLVDGSQNWHMLTPKHRRNVRKATRNGVEVETTDKTEDFSKFYQLMSEHHRVIGSPFFGKRVFSTLFGPLVESGQAVLLMARHAQRVVGGHLLLRSGRTLISKYSASQKSGDASHLYVGYALFWKAIELGIKEGFESLNLGITGRSHTGLLDFKTRFGADTRDIHFYTRTFKGSAPNYARYYRAYGPFRVAWRYLPELVRSTIGDMANRWIC